MVEYFEAHETFNFGSSGDSLVLWRGQQRELRAELEIAVIQAKEKLMLTSILLMILHQESYKLQVTFWMTKTMVKRHHHWVTYFITKLTHLLFYSRVERCHCNNH